MQNDEGQPSQPIHHIVYCSQTAQHMDKEALEKIIVTARHHNSRFGITGLLVFGSGIFFQWLEGPRDNVTSLSKIISADPRHSNVVLLTKEDEFRERLFPNWDMELVAAEDISAVLEDAMHEATDPKQKNTLSKMLQELNKNPLGRLKLDWHHSHVSNLASGFEEDLLSAFLGQSTAPTFDCNLLTGKQRANTPGIFGFTLVKRAVTANLVPADLDLTRTADSLWLSTTTLSPLLGAW